MVQLDQTDFLINRNSRVIVLKIGQISLTLQCGERKIRLRAMQIKTRVIYPVLLILTMLSSNVIPYRAVAQKSIHDSLVKVTKTAAEDSVRLSAFLELSQIHWEDSLEQHYYQKALEIAQNSPGSNWEDLVSLHRVNVLHQKGEYDLAMEKALELTKAYGSDESSYRLGRAHQLAGKIAWKLNEIDRAIFHRQKAVEIFTDHGNSEELIKSLTNLGVVYKNAGMPTQALESLLSALTLAEEQKDTLQQARILNNLGNVYKSQNELDAALKAHERALEFRLKLQNKNQLADTYNNLGLVYRRLEQFEKAREFFNKSLLLRFSTEDERGKSYTYNNLALLFLDIDQPDSAIHYLDKSMEIKEKLGVERDLASGHANLGEAYLAKGEPIKSKEHYEEALRLVKTNKYREVELEALDGLSKVMEQLGNFTQAYSYLRRHDQLEDSVFEQTNQRSIAELRASYELQKAQNEMSQLEQQQRLQELELQNYELERNSLIMLLVAVGIIILMVLLRFRSVSQFNKQLKDTNDELRATLISNEEKETLLKEIHHRVKNNLQIITSLIRLQSSSINDPEVAALFNESQHRIKTMALVHEELYKTKNFTSVNVRNYLEQLTNDLIETYALKNNVEVKLETDVIKLGINTLIPMGLMVNEIITNALKHAFDGQKGEIKISLHDRDKNQFELVIQDSGRGFPPGLDFDNPSSLGLELVNTLTEQLDGKVSFSNAPGARYHILFRCQD